MDDVLENIDLDLADPSTVRALVDEADVFDAKTSALAMRSADEMA